MQAIIRVDENKVHYVFDYHAQKRPCNAWPFLSSQL